LREDAHKKGASYNMSSCAGGPISGGSVWTKDANTAIYRTPAEEGNILAAKKIAIRKAHRFSQPYHPGPKKHINLPLHQTLM
jgi:hypothetical protein